MVLINVNLFKKDLCDTVLLKPTWHWCLKCAILAQTIQYVFNFKLLTQMLQTLNVSK